MSQHFRPCAGAIVFNSSGLVLVGNRIDVTEEAWQFPQGGIEKGETPLIAAERELFEETSVQSVCPIYTDANPRRYEFPLQIKERFAQKGISCDGQDIYFTLFYFNGTGDEINVQTKNPEFREVGWKNFDFVVKNIIDFKRDVYQKSFEKFMPMIRQYLDEHS